MPPLLRQIKRGILENPLESAFLAGGCALRLSFLGAKSLWFDEANTLCVAKAPLEDLLPLVRDLEGAPPLHYLLMHFWLPLFQDPRLALRLFSALCGIVSLFAFRALARRVLPGGSGMALFLACASSFWIQLAQDGRGYALFLLLSLAATLGLWTLKDRWSPRLAAAYAATALAGLYTHNFAGFLLLGHAAYLLGLKRDRPRELLPWLGVYAAVAILYVPWLPQLLVQTRHWAQVSVLERGLDLAGLGQIVGTMVFDAGFLDLAIMGWTTAVGLAALAALGAGLLASPGRERGPVLFCLANFAAPLAAAAALERSLGKSAAQARYFVFLSPFLYLLLAALATRASRGLRPALRTLLALIFALGTAAYFAASVYVDPRLESLAAALRRGDRRAPVVHLDPYYYTPLRYYYLPERPHVLAGAELKKLNWEALPGYPAVLSSARLAGLGPCLVVDPQREFFERRLGLSTGKEVLALLRARPSTAGLPRGS